MDNQNSRIESLRNSSCIAFENDVNIGKLNRQDKAVNSIVDGYSDSYVTRVLRGIYEIDCLSEILNKVSRIDYFLKYYEQRMEDFDIVELISTLYRELQEAAKLSDRLKIRKEIGKYEIDNGKKYVILVEELLSIAESINSGLGVNDTFPYFYNGKYWELTLKENIKEFLAECATRSGINSFDVRVNHNSEKLYEQFQYSATILSPVLSQDTVLINLQNGTFEIKGEKQKLREFRSVDMLKYQLPFNYDPLAQAPMFKQFLDEVIPEKESQMVLSEYIGSIFAKGLKLEKCLVLIGDGANGKSVIYDIIRALLGEENISSYTLGNLCDDRGYYRAQLTNKLLNYSSELGGKNCNPDTVKKLISREPIDARSPYGKPFELKNYCALMFNTNSELKGMEYTNAYMRRFLWLRFDKIIPEDKQDKNLAQKIIDKELSGIFNWVLEGLQRILKNQKFTESKHIIEVSKEVMNSTNSVAIFVEEKGYKPGNSNSLDLKSFRSMYDVFCDDNGLKHYKVGRKEFSKRLKLLGFEIIFDKAKSTNKNTVLFDEIELSNEKELDILITNMGRKD